MGCDKGTEAYGI